MNLTQHKKPHPMKGQQMIFKSLAIDTDNGSVKNGPVVVEDWLDRIIGLPWHQMIGYNKLAGVYRNRWSRGIRHHAIVRDSEVVLVKDQQGNRLPVHQEELHDLDSTLLGRDELYRGDGGNRPNDGG